jgi:vancomycin permeability regulator SanA
VLGARVYPDGRPSALLRRRLGLAAELYRRGTVQVLLVSGDGTGPGTSRDETRSMVDHLLGLGVPAIRIVVDPHGVDTWHSAFGARAVFGVRSLVVVSQRYHLPRAVALCRRAGITAVGLGDDSATAHPGPTRIGRLREIPACVKAVGTLLVPPGPAAFGASRADGITAALGTGTPDVA